MLNNSMSSSRVFATSFLLQSFLFFASLKGNLDLSKTKKVHEEFVPSSVSSKNPQISRTVNRAFGQFLREGSFPEDLPKKIIKALLDGENINDLENNYGIPPLILAVALGNLALLEFLLSKNNLEVNLASDEGINSLLVSLGLYLAFKKGTILEENEEEGSLNYLKIAELLVKNNANLSPKITKMAKNFSVKSLSFEDDSNLQKYLSENLFTEKVKKSLLLFSVKSNLYYVARLFFVTGDDFTLDIKDKNGKSLINMAIENENEKLVKLLVDNGVDLSIESSGLSPLSLAKILGNKEIIELVEQGINAQKSNKNMKEIDENFKDLI